MSTQAKLEAQVKGFLTSFRDAPVTTQGATDAVLAVIYNYLMGVKPGVKDGTLHWFCPRANDLTINAATFLMRLFAYESRQVEVWKEKFNTCMAGCCDCVWGLEAAKESSKDTYFAAFERHVLHDFYNVFHGWELKTVIEALDRAGFSQHDATRGKPMSSLSKAPPVVLYRAVCNLRLLQDEQILAILRAHTPSEPVVGWPISPPPAGILLLLMIENENLRRWAKTQVAKGTRVAMAKEKFTNGYVTIIQAVAHSISADGAGFAEILGEPGATSLVPTKEHPGFPFSKNPVDLWAGIYDFISFVPPARLIASGQRDADLRCLVIGHLHDVGPHFVDVLRCLLLLLSRLGSDMWRGEGPEYPHIVFDAIKDNPLYSDMLQGIAPDKDRPWFLAVFAELLTAVRHLPVYGDMFAKMVDFMCEELQHERFKGARPMIMTTAIKLVSSHLRRTENSPLQTKAVQAILTIHTNIFISVAFAPSHDDGQWASSREAARSLVTTIMSKDVDDVVAAIKELCRLLAGLDVKIPLCDINREFWIRSYRSIQMSDFDSISAIIAIAAQASHLDILKKNSFIPALSDNKGSETAKSGELVLDSINTALKTVSTGFLEVLSKCANNSSAQLLDLIRRPGMVQNIMVLMLSPDESLQAAAQMLVGQAFDVDGRLDCFRAMLENLPDASLEGLFQFMETFIKYSPVVPEACNLSKSLVRCLTDIIEVLCSANNGLLLQVDRWARVKDEEGPATKLSKLWHLMSNSITVIFRRTPLWSLYFEPEEMILWMRDALIFGRDMLAQRRVFESTASLAAREVSSSKPKRGIAQAMLDDLQDAFTELARWLRLTDEELLHQSFALLQSLLDCFRESHVLPSPAGVARLTKHIDDARKKDPSRPQTRLDATRLSKLEDALAAFDEDDDEVQIISHTIRPSKKSEVDSRPAKVREVAQLNRPPTVSKATAAAPPSKIYFTKDDQKKLDKRDPLPTFRRQEKVSLPSASRVHSSHSSDGARSDGASNTGPADSSDDSDSEEGESQSDLAALVKLQKSPKVRKPIERRQVKMLDIPSKGNRGFNDRLAQRQDARRTALRLKPDISGLHRALLSWNYDHAGPLPPSFSQAPRLQHIPDYFTDHSHYLSIFEPLLLLECWSQILQSKDEPQESCDCKITSRQFIDNWLDLDVTISEPVPKSWYLTETDVILLRNPGGKSNILAKVRSYRATPQGINAAFRALTTPTQPDPGLQINTQWRLSKVFSLSTLHREYAALMAVPYFDSFERILRPRLLPIPAIDRQSISRTMARHRLNEPQAIAILGSMQVEGFSLIQGPPGTGKTSTICGLVYTFLEGRQKPATMLNMGRNGVSSDREPVKKILLCAPSNAAIDEVAHRLKEMRSVPGNPPIKVVRMGAEKSMNIAVKDISLDSLVDQKLNTDQAGKGTAPKDTDNEVSLVRSELDAVKKMKEQKATELASVQNNAERTYALDEDIKKLNNRRIKLAQQLDKLKDKQKNQSRSNDAVRRKFRAEVLYEADVICSTLSGAGIDTLDQFDFEMVVIDEAAQAIELSSLIPLKFSCRNCIMVGDPQQLPPTVISQEASKYKYNQSLFVRLQKHQPEAVHLLSIQYRMHPEISQLPSHLFYQARLLDGPDMATKTAQPWQSHEKFGTYQFYNVARGQEHKASHHSIKNDTECQVAVALYNRLKQEHSTVDFDYRVGVVSMYQGQISELKRQFQSRFGFDIIDKIHFSTVDGFQGQEKDIIILSCVRAGPGLQNIGFLSDLRRMNVALTRAKSSLFILGHAATLERSNDTWRKIVADARTRSRLIEANVGFFTAPNLPRSAAPRLTQSKPPIPPTLPPPPQNLLTPQDLMDSVNSDVNSSVHASKTMQASESIGLDSTEGADAVPLAQDVQMGQKRPADHEAAEQPSVSTSSEPRPKPALPPAKRQKKDKGSIFIPKKPNKRP